MVWQGAQKFYLTSPLVNFYFGVMLPGKNEFERMFHLIIESKRSEVITTLPFTHQHPRVWEETEINEIIIWWAWPI